MAFSFTPPAAIARFGTRLGHAEFKGALKYYVHTSEDTCECCCCIPHFPAQYGLIELSAPATVGSATNDAYPLDGLSFPIRYAGFSGTGPGGAFVPGDVHRWTSRVGVLERPTAGDMTITEFYTFNTTFGRFTYLAFEFFCRGQQTTLHAYTRGPDDTGPFGGCTGGASAFPNVLPADPDPAETWDCDPYVQVFHLTQNSTIGGSPPALLCLDPAYLFEFDATVTIPG
jgi:hypothetical protein